MSAVKVHLTTPTGPAACGLAIHVGMTTTRYLRDVTCLACQATHVQAVGPDAGQGATGQDSTDVLVRKPLSQILTFWRPGSHDWSWQEEFADLIDHPVTEEIRRRVDAEGFGFIDHLAPVMLGSDGRVWDGHHRICLAIEQGRDSLMVEIVEPPQGAPAHEFVHYGMWADCICGRWSISADDAESDGRSEFRAHVEEAERVEASEPSVKKDPRVERDERHSVISDAIYEHTIEAVDGGLPSTLKAHLAVEDVHSIADSLIERIDEAGWTVVKRPSRPVAPSCCPGAGSMAHVRGCRNHPEADRG